MKPLKLMMRAFGPYKGEEVIDFTQLENHRLFVISGKTGAGKTTILMVSPLLSMAAEVVPTERIKSRCAANLPRTTCIQLSSCCLKCTTGHIVYSGSFPM